MKILLLLALLVFAGCDDKDGGRVITDGDEDAGADPTGDAGDDDDSDASTPPDGGGGGGTFDCGAETCDLESQECCGGGADATCVDTGTCEGPAFSCDGPEDCGDGVCCAVMNGGTGGTACGEAGDCGGSVICAGDGDCPDGEECCAPQSDMTPVGGFCASNCPGPG